MRKKSIPITPLRYRYVNPSIIVSSLIITGAAMAATEAARAAARWYDRSVPGLIERVEISKMTASAVMGKYDDTTD